MPKLSIFFRSEQSSTAAQSYSPSAGKPALAVADWQQRFGDRISLHSFEPVTRDTLALAHDADYVDGVLDCTVENGFGNKSLGIAASLPYTVGSFVAAVNHVLTTDAMIAISPTSGFHHAGHDFGGGFCTFNGLLVAAIQAHQQGMADKILILDFDAHHGNGTADIIKRLKLDYITHITANKSYDTAKQAMAASDILSSGIMEAGFDLVLYQAGADIHVNDPLGGLLSTVQMAQRDANILAGCSLYNVPLVACLAGGYQRDLNGTIEPVLALHRETIRQCIEENEAIHEAHH